MYNSFSIFCTAIDEPIITAVSRQHPAVKTNFVTIKKEKDKKAFNWAYPVKAPLFETDDFFYDISEELDYDIYTAECQEKGIQSA